MYLVALVIFVILACIVMSSQTKKGYLSELEKALGLKDFKMSGFLGDAQLSATWKEIPITIVVRPHLLTKQAPIQYVMNHRFGFAANITAGEGLKNGGAAAAKKTVEDDTARPWRVKLTEEEQKIIEARRGGAEAERELNKFNITASAVDVVSKFMKNAEHAKAVEDLLRAGISEVIIDMDKVIAVKKGYSNNDMTHKQVETFLNGLKELIS